MRGHYQSLFMCNVWPLVYGFYHYLHDKGHTLLLHKGNMQMARKVMLLTKTCGVIVQLCKQTHLLNLANYAKEVTCKSQAWP